MIDSLGAPVRDVVAELVAAGAQGVMLFGSSARGDTHAHSDVDLLALGAGAPYTLLQRGGTLIAIAWEEPEGIRARFARPLEVGSIIPGWREGVILHDPAGRAAALQAAARDWTWDAVPGCDACVAEEITGLAEEVHKLVGALADGRAFMAVVQRNILSLRLPVVMSLHCRLLYGTENVLWDRVAAVMGERWAAAQARAFGLGGEALAESCAAALTLYTLAAEATAPLFSAEQRAVVAHACRISGRSPA